jgi:DNA-binding transcriptional ArsR family regulator
MPRHIRSIVPDTTALKALAHPVRVRMLGLLRIHGPATATSLAARLKLNSGATSYHLRQLAEHGFIEEAGDLGNRRERWWRAAHESTNVDIRGSEGEAAEAGLAFLQAALSWQVSQMQRALELTSQQPREWREASTVSDWTIPLTAAEAKALTERVQALLWEVKSAAPPLGDASEDTRPFTVVFHSFPLPPEPEG